jgi:intracellular multiplication protein IcmS
MDFNKGLCRIAQHLNIHFTLNGRPLRYEEVFSEVGLLPAIARRADQLCSLCLGYGIGVSFDEFEDSPLKIKVTFDDVTPATLRYLCITDVLCELRRMSSSPSQVALDELLYD